MSSTGIPSWNLARPRKTQARAKATGSTVTMDDAVAELRASRDLRQVCSQKFDHAAAADLILLPRMREPPPLARRCVVSLPGLAWATIDGYEKPLPL